MGWIVAGLAIFGAYSAVKFLGATASEANSESKKQQFFGIKNKETNELILDKEKDPGGEQALLFLNKTAAEEYKKDALGNSELYEVVLVESDLKEK